MSFCWISSGMVLSGYAGYYLPNELFWRCNIIDEVDEVANALSDVGGVFSLFIGVLNECW